MRKRSAWAYPPLVPLLLVSVYVASLYGVALLREHGQSTHAAAEAVFAESDARLKALTREVEQERAVAEAWERRITVLEAALQKAEATP